MSGNISKIIKVILYTLLGISAIIGVCFYALTFGMSESEAEVYYASAGITEVVMKWSYALVIIGALAAIVFAFLGMAKNPKGAKSALIGVGALIIVFGLSYALGGDEMTPKYEKFISGPGESKLVSMGIIAFYILAGMALISTVFSGFIKLFK